MTEENRKIHAERMRAYGKTPEGLEKIKKMANAIRGKKGHRVWTKDSGKKNSESRKKTHEENKHKFYIKDNELKILSDICHRDIKGTSIKEFEKTIKILTIEELEKYLSDNLVETITELEEMKLDADKLCK